MVAFIQNRKLEFVNSMKIDLYFPV